LFTRAVWRHQAQDGDGHILSLVEKVLHASPSPHVSLPGWIAWYREAGVYTDADFMASHGLRLPRIYGMWMPSRDLIHIYMEDLHTRCRHPTAPNYPHVAEQLGEFGGWASARNLWRKPWLAGTETFIKPPADPGRIERGFNSIFTDDSARKLARSQIEDFVAYHSLNESKPRALGPATVAHGDIHLNNLFVDSTTGEAVAIDWLRVQIGRFGEDLANMMRLWPRIAKGTMSVEEYINMDAQVLAAYVKGAQKVVDIAEKTIQRNYAFRLAIYLLRDIVDPRSRFMLTVSDNTRAGIQKFVSLIARRLHELMDIPA